VRIDLNADLGESDAPDADVALLELVSSANVACGFHAGGPALMHRAVRAARGLGVALGAHPSYPGSAGFGRVAVVRPDEEVVDDVLYQVGALAAIAAAEGVRLSHVKPHGALYTAASESPALALTLARALAGFDGRLRLTLRAASPGLAAVRAAGFAALAEGFADRAYLAGGRLAPRDRPGALLTEPARVAERAVALARGAAVATEDGGAVRLEVDTLCLHGDTPGAAGLARAARAALEAAGFEVAPA